MDSPWVAGTLSVATPLKIAGADWNKPSKVAGAHEHASAADMGSACSTQATAATRRARFQLRHEDEILIITRLRIAPQ
jgi:hypothetical protein